MLMVNYLGVIAAVLAVSTVVSAVIRWLFGHHGEEAYPYPSDDRESDTKTDNPAVIPLDILNQED